MSEYQEDLKYNKSHTWLKLEQDVAILGAIQQSIDNAQDVIMIKLPEIGQIIEIGDIYASIESVKWSGHLESPVTGEVIEINRELDENPEKLNEDAYKNWIIKIKHTNISQELMNAKEAKKEYEDT